MTKRTDKKKKDKEDAMPPPPPPPPATNDDDDDSSCADDECEDCEEEYEDYDSDSDFVCGDDECEYEDDEYEEDEYEEDDADYRYNSSVAQHTYFDDQTGTPIPPPSREPEAEGVGSADADAAAAAAYSIRSLPMIFVSMMERAAENEQAQAPSTRKRTASISEAEPKKKNPRFDKYSKEEKAYFEQLPVDDQLRVGETESLVQTKNQVKIPTRFKVLMSNIDDSVKAVAIKKADYLSNMNPGNGEYHKMSNWIDALCRIPIGKYAGLPLFTSVTNVSASSPTPSMDEISAFLARTQGILDAAVYGHTESKDQIIRFLAQWIVNPKTKGSVIGIHGPPGVGKTTLVKDGICKALEIPFASIPLGGASDGAYLDGHSYTYEGSTWGRIVSVLMEAGCMNPVLYMDEVDKLSGRKADEITGILIHLTDPAQNTAFSDKYFTDVPIDLSRSIMVFTYNDPEMVSPILRDRMISIEVGAYTEKDKLEISRKHLIPDLCKQFNFGPTDVDFSDAMVKRVIGMIDDEAGVRGLRRGLEHVFSGINLGRLIPETSTGKPKYALPVVVTTPMLEELAKKVQKKSCAVPMGMYT